MARSARFNFAGLLSSGLACGVLLVSCSSAPSSMAGSTAGSDRALPEAAPAPSEAEADQMFAQEVTGSSGSSPSNTTPIPAPPEAPRATQAKPQLIKIANLSLEVEDAIASVKTIRTLVEKQQGDVLNLQENTIPGTATPRSAQLELRVPAARLELTLDELAKLGQVENRAIAAEDVSGQLVDAEARLRNLRKQEEMTLKIMERSGEIKDVLAVSQELSNVRQSIEQLDAQLQSLKTRVAYSTINLSIQEPLAAAGIEPNLGNEIKSAWGNATRSVGAFSRGLMVVGLWLLAYSPYLGLLAAAIYFGRQALRSRSTPSHSPSSANASSGGEP